MLYCKNMIKCSKVFPLNTANVVVVMGTDNLVPSVDGDFSDTMLLGEKQICIVLKQKKQNANESQA